MSIKSLKTAIARLKELKAEATPFPWTMTHGGDVRGPDTPGLWSWLAMNFVIAGDRADAASESDSALIVVLSRTADPILDLLRFARGLANAQIKGEQAAATVDLAVYLARAILGEVEHD